MKTITKLGLLVLPLFLAASASASDNEGLGHWTGSGTTFGVDGKELGDFTVDVNRTAIDDKSVEVRGEVTLATGKVIDFEERQLMSGNGFRIESSRGNGGGRCFGAGLCETYKDLGDGKAEATTVVVDGADKLRVLVTELDHGRATRFIRQTLTRTQ